MSRCASRCPGRLRGGLAATGLTYVELLVAVLVMAVLTTVALPTGLQLRRRAQERELRIALATIRDAIDEYHRDWELGYIESDHEHGWPRDVEELLEEIEYWGPPPGASTDPTAAGALGGTPTAGGGIPTPGSIAGRTGGLPSAAAPEPTLKRYLRRLPRDPFNDDDNDWDTAGWRARSYEDDPDSSSWGGEGLYDVYSGADWLALDGRSRYAEW